MATAIRKSPTDRAFDVVNIGALLLITLIMLYPLYFIAIASFSDPYAVANGKIFMLPRGFTLDAYRNVFRNQRIWIGYRNTVVYTALGTCFNLVLTIPAAYVLSKKNLPGRFALSWIFLFTMYFSGGLIPTYLLVKGLNLIDKPMVLVVLGGLSVYNMIVTRSFFQTSIPEELYESARIDGASDFRCFFQIALPLSSSILAVMALFYAVTHWNSFFNALIYINNEKYYPLQLVLRNILINNQNILADIDISSMDEDTVMDMAKMAYMAESMKYSLIFIACAPLLCAYPFVQKYFVKGMLIGSIKG